MIIYNNIVPVKGFKLMNLFGLIFARKDVNIRDYDLTHEQIHTKQIVETLGLIFYLWYGIEWFIKLFTNKFNSKKAYRAISFEREAYAHQYEKDYPETRKHYSWLKLLKL